MSNQLIVSLFSAVDANDWVKLEAIFHPSVVYERPGYAAFNGLDALLRFYRSERVIESGAHLLEQIVVDGDHGACWGRFTGLRKDGTPIDERFADVYRFADGRIRERRTHFYRPAV